MNVHVRSSGRLIKPFDEPPGEAFIMNRRLSEWQSEAFRAAGLTVVPTVTPPCVVVTDALFVTGPTLRDFVVGAAGRNAVMVLKQSLVGRHVAPVQPRMTEIPEGWRFEDVRFEAGTDDDYVDVVVDPDEIALEFPVPEYYMGTDKVEFSLPRCPAMELHHWAHILWANQIAGAIEGRSIPKWRWVLRLLWAIVRARSINRWRVLSKLNRIGRKCDIHPTAVIEGSTLGDGVTVGPHCFVQLSTIGDGASLQPGSQVVLSTLGERAIISQQTVVRFCVLYPEAVASQYLMQACVLGRRVITTAGSFSMDLNFDNPVRVPLDGGLHSTGQRLLGSAFGHNARVGTGFWMASGRALPNDSFTIRDPRQVIRRIPEGLAGEGPLVNDVGTLRPLEQVLPKKTDECS